MDILVVQPCPVRSTSVQYTTLRLVPCLRGADGQLQNAAVSVRNLPLYEWAPYSSAAPGGLDF